MKKVLDDLEKKLETPSFSNTKSENKINDDVFDVSDFDLPISSDLLLETTDNNNIEDTFDEKKSETPSFSNTKSENEINGLFDVSDIDVPISDDFFWETDNKIVDTCDEMWYFLGF